MNGTKSAGATILLVEDCSVICSFLAELLGRSGHRVWRAATGAEARVTLERARPDLIILDLPLPDIDGLVLCTTVKVIVDVPVVLCGPVTEQRERILGLKLGADDYIVKPFDVEEFEVRL